MERMEAIIARINEQESRITLLEHRLSPTELRAAEPAPGSDAEHPPVGYVLVPHASGEVIEADWIVWSFDRGPWKPLRPDSVGDRAHGGFHPMARPIPANEGDSRLAESVAIPVGWKAVPEGIHREIPVKIRRRIASGAGLVLLIYPDPSIPWGEGYEAILPEEHDCGDEYKDRHQWREWMTKDGYQMENAASFAWRRRIPATTPTEPARDLSAEVGRLEEWQEAGLTATMMWDVIQLMRKTLDCDGTTTPVERAERVMRTIDELRDTVERMEAELDTTKRLLAESLVERDRLKNLHDARKVRIEGFRDVLRERLGDLV